LDYVRKLVAELEVGTFGEGSQTQDELFVRFMLMTFKLYLLIPKQVNVNSQKIELSVK
jgi:hypothetical protein